jgi:glycerophosphoryl diester phosphodiesterase
VQLVAHRGFGERYPENTVCSVREASSTADCVEIDVRRSGSGDLVASHFDRLFWVTDATGCVGDRSTEELQSLSVGGSDCGIPRLERATAAVPPDVGIELDLKEPGLAADALAAVDAADNDVVVSSFYSDALWEARSIDAEVSLAYNFDVRLDRNLNTTRLLDCERANLHWAICLGTDAVERAHELGADVYAWPVGSRVVSRALDRVGVDGVIATRPAAGERDAESPASLPGGGAIAQLLGSDS